LVWLLVITLFRLPVGIRSGFGWWLAGIFGLWVGAAVGTFIFDLDHLFYTFLIYSDEPTSFKVKELFKSGKYQEMISVLVSTRFERIKLTFHNALFQVFFSGLAFFAITSSGSSLGIGVVMAMALHLLVNEFKLLLTGRDDYLKQMLFWPVKLTVSTQNLKFFVVVMLLVFLSLNLLLI
jgi:hypothetical protein